MASNPKGELAAWERRLVWVDEHFFSIESLFNFIAALVILTLMLVGVFQVVGRTIFNFPVPGYVDWVELCMGTFAFLGIAYCQRLGTHVRMEILINRFRGRSLWLIEAYGTVIAMFLVGVLTYYGYLHFERAYVIGDSTIDIRLPFWPSKLMVPVAFTLLMIRLTIQLVGFCRLVAKPDAAPIGVPLVADLEAQVQHELEDAFGRGEAAYQGGPGDAAEPAPRSEDR